MPFLRLRDLRDNQIHEFDGPEVRLGRDPDFELPISGEGSEVVSGSHARFVHRDGAWWVEDIGGRNGTFVEGQRVQAGNAIRVDQGQVVALGSRGARFEVDATQDRRVAETLMEQPLASPDDATAPMDPYVPPGAETPPPPPPPALVTPTTEPVAAAPEIRLRLHDLRSGGDFEATGGRIRIGRGKECELRPVEIGDASVSRTHCEVVLLPEGGVVVRDARSRNGTLLNGEPLSAERPLAVGDRIQLGDAGPELLVERLEGPGVAAPVPPPPAPKHAAAPPATPAPRGPEPVAAPAAPAAAAPVAAPEDRRSFGGKGRTIFIRDLIDDTHRKSVSRVRWIVWSFVVLLVVGLGGLYWWSEQRVRATEAELASQRRELEAARASADSVRLAAVAEYQRLSVALVDARESSAPAEVVDSLRSALESAEQRTAALENALERAQTAVAAQLAAGESMRRAAQEELERLRAEVAGSGGNVSRELLDSLREAVHDAERRASEIAANVRAVRGTDLAAVAQANQGAVGLVSTFAGTDIFDGSGFAVTASGYFITNRHVVRPEGRAPDSVFVTMADHRTMSRADVIAVESARGGPDLAVIRIRNYSGPYVAGVDWIGNRARQGEPAALIGFPAGVAAAMDQTRTVRTSMSAGIFSKVTPELIQFDGFTVGGSSGSPVFNAQGEVVSVHARGLREAAGLGFTVPVRLVLSLLPPDARRELGL